MAVIKTDPQTTYDGYLLIAATNGRVWHLSNHDDEALCRAKVDRYIELEEAAELSGICARCSRILDRRGPYVPYAERVAAGQTEPTGPRPALGPSSVDGWELLYDKPRAGYEIGRRYWGDKPEYALICKAHRYALGIGSRLKSEGVHRRAGNWCPGCNSR
jgi:hypothetical protein